MSRILTVTLAVVMAMPFAARAQDESQKTRDELTGKTAPAIKVKKTLNAPKGFKLDKLKGKVVVFDFWATWCPPCRAVVPELVKMQKELESEGVQVVGITKFYGRGMDFSDEGMSLPHGGKRVDNLKEEEELKVNENFVKAFEVNYPIVFTDNDAAKNYGIRGIPTIFVLDRKGKIVGHVVGGNHARLHELVQQALGKGEKSDSANGSSSN